MPLSHSFISHRKVSSSRQPKECKRGLKSEIGAEIDFANGAVREDRVRVSFGDNTPFAHNIRLSTDIERLSDVVIGEQNADPACTQMFDDLFDVIN